MPGRSILSSFVLLGLSGTLAFSAKSKAESPPAAQAPKAETVSEYSLVPVCTDTSEAQSRERVLAESIGPVVAALLERKCSVWIGDGRNAPVLVSPGERPGVAVLSPTPASDVSAILTGLPGSVQAESVTVEAARWRALREDAEWLTLPRQLLRLDRTALPKLTIGALPAGYLELQIQAGDIVYDLPRVLLEAGGWADLGKVRPRRSFTVCGNVVGWTSEMDGMELYWAPTTEGAQEQRVDSFEAGHFCLPALEDEMIWVWGEGGGWSSEPIQIRTSTFVDQPLEVAVSMNERLYLSWFPPEVDKVSLEIYGELTIGPRTHLTRLEGTEATGQGYVILPRHRPLIVIARPEEPKDLNLAPALKRIISTEVTEEVELVFEPSSRIHGRITSETDKPVAGVRVVALLSSDASEIPLQVQVAQSDSAGEYELEHLPPGEFELVARREGFLESRLRRGLSSDANRRLDISLSRGERITGVVLDARTGAPLPGAQVQLVGHYMRTVFTGSDGTFDFDGVAPGTYSIKADAPHRRQAHERLTVGRGAEPRHLRMEMATGTRWQTRVVGYSGVPSRITILRASESYSVPVAADGRFVLENGPDGLVGFTLTAADGGLLCTGGVEIPPGTVLMNSELACSQRQRQE